MNLGQFFRDLAEVVGTYNDKEKIDLRVLGQQIENVAKWIDNTGSKQRIQNAKIEHAFIPGGEIRFGKGTPGSSTNPFTGIRISDTGMTYGGTTYYIVNVFEDEVTSGTNIDTGEQETGEGSVLFNTEGIVIQADETGRWLTFNDENEVEIATIFQDGAGNLQVDIADPTKSFTINGGNVIINHASGTGGHTAIFENNVRRCLFGWDGSNVVMENEVSGSDFLVILDGASPTTEFWTFYDRANSTARFRLANAGYFDIQKTASDPAYEDGYAKLYFYSDGAGTDEIRVRAKIGATETQATLADISP